MDEKQSAYIKNLSKDEQIVIIKRIKYVISDCLHITQYSFARSIGYSQSYISRTISLDKDLTESFIDKIVSTYDIDPDWLLYGSGTAPEELDQSSVVDDKKAEALRLLCKVYNLNSKDADFISELLALPYEKRSKLYNSTRAISGIDI